MDEKEKHELQEARKYLADPLGYREPRVIWDSDSIAYLDPGKSPFNLLKFGKNKKFKWKDPKDHA